MRLTLIGAMLSAVLAATSMPAAADDWDICVGLDPDAAVRSCTAIIDGGGPKHRCHAALAIIEIGLQQVRGFACVHAGVVEVELGHRACLSLRRIRGEPQMNLLRK